MNATLIVSEGFFLYCLIESRENSTHSCRIIYERAIYQMKIWGKFNNYYYVYVKLFESFVTTLLV